ncbi:MAG: hypothetical protein M3Y48_24240 [Actinomycetota bacterium]|nr:hypothetical protein [Actinomycetota bacterium]
MSSTAPTEDMIVPLVPTPAASIVWIDPDNVAQEYGCDIAPQRHLREPASTPQLSDDALDRALVPPAPLCRDSLR